MSFTLDNYIKLLQPHLNSVFSDGRYKAAIGRVAKCLPPFTFGGLERFLGFGQTRVDLNISVDTLLQEHRMLLQQIDSMPMFGSKEFESSISGLRHFLEHWVKDDFQLHPFIDHLWLAYDIVNPNEPVSIPWYYLTFTRTPLCRDPFIKAAIVFRSLHYLEERLDEVSNKMLSNFFHQLPPSIFVRAIGIQKNRSIRSLRVYLVMSNFEELVTLLASIGWKGDMQDLCIRTNPFVPDCSFYGLGIDLAPDVQPKIGIEFWHKRRPGNSGLREKLNMLLSLSLCTPDQRNSFLKWEGLTISDLPIVESPTEGRLPHCTVHIRRMARYIKLVYETGRPLLAKCYYGFDRQQ